MVVQCTCHANLSSFHYMVSEKTMSMKLLYITITEWDNMVP